jgi:hypothetical protein
LPRQECAALARREADRQRGFASTSHIETFQVREREGLAYEDTI